MTELDSSISREKIEEAKQKLGDRNAEIIAQVLNIQKYNPQRKIGCCPNPAHQDDQPSCSYNPKTHSFYCFGCHARYDVIDSYVATGDTFLQACEKLFKEADMPHNFSYRGIPSDRDYVYPKPEWAEDKTPVYEYWEKRCISRETIDALGIQCDRAGNTNFPYYSDEDVLLCVKVRPSRAIRKDVDKQKCWWLKPSDITQVLWRSNCINPTAPLIICSGEGDCAAAYECGFTNATSLPGGDANLNFISTQWEWINRFDSIIFVHDNDAAGEKCTRELTRRLGEYRCRVVDLPQTYKDDDGVEHHIKDLNEYLFYAGKRAVIDAINNAKEREVESVVDFADVTDFDMNSVEGVKTGFAELDEVLGALYCGTTTILTGVPGSGKSSFLSTIIGQALDQGFPTWVYSAELSAPLFKNWVNSVLAGQGNMTQGFHDNRTVYRITPDAVKDISSHYKGQLFIYKDSEPPTVTRLFESIEASVKRYGVRCVVLDNLSCVSLECNASDRWEKQNQMLMDLVDLAKKLDVALMAVIHPHKIECIRPLSLYDLAGVATSANLAHRVLSLYRVQESDREPNRSGKVKPMSIFDCTISVLKDRFGSAGNKTFGFFFDPVSRRFYTDPDNLAHRYNWDHQTTQEQNLRYFDMQKYMQVIGQLQEPF